MCHAIWFLWVSSKAVQILCLLCYLFFVNTRKIWCPMFDRCALFNTLLTLDDVIWKRTRGKWKLLSFAAAANAQSIVFPSSRHDHNLHHYIMHRIICKSLMTIYPNIASCTGIDIRRGHYPFFHSYSNSPVYINESGYLLRKCSCWMQDSERGKKNGYARGYGLEWR